MTKDRQKADLLDLDVRVMVKIDPDNPMDLYAADRLASLQLKFAHTGEPGQLFEKDDDSSEFQRLVSLFEEAWSVAIPIEQKKPRLSRGRLRSILQRYSGIRPANTEREFQLMLMGYLKGQIHPSIIDAEATIVDTRIDLLVGPKPHAERSGIEVKFKATDKDVDGIVGKLRNYKGNVGDLVLVVAAPEFTPQGRSRLLAELNAIDVALIELR